MTEETLSFQAEVSRLLDIVANALYSNKEIFLRELISNASDACDRLRYLGLTKPELIGDDQAFGVTLTIDKRAKTLTVTDNGIGMNREELVENLGTIARSGTAAFLDQMDDKKDGAGLIGKFGVGFYSAFMVADRVELKSRKAGDEAGWSWTSDGKGAYAIADCAEAPPRGTEVILHLKKGEQEYLDPDRLQQVVKTYSDHIAVPIRLVGDGGAETQDPVTINAASAIWTRAKSEVSEDQYKEFYHHVGHAFDDPWARLHFKVEGKIEYTGLLFIPSAPPFDLFHPDRKNQVKLYVRRVFITDDCAELLPSSLRFLRGVIDSEDLPLNISRELLQHNPMLAKIRTAVTKRVVSELKKRAGREDGGYIDFWKNFGAVLKEGIYEDEARREALLELARFRSTANDTLTSLADYVGRMKEGQDAIYYISGDNAEAMQRSPQLEGFAAKGVEVLLFSDPVDDFWTSVVPEYQGKAFKSATRGDADLSAIKSAEAEEEKKNPEDEGDLAGLIAYFKLVLKDEVKDVRNSERLTSSAVCLVADDGDIDMHMERILKQHRQLDSTALRIMEVNPGHPMIKSLSARISKEGAGSALENIAKLLLDQARILEGENLPDPTAFSERLAAVIESGLETA
jgi:molecular chaperone HtpG